jgi:hypothetical protein
MFIYKAMYPIKTTKGRSKALAKSTALVYNCSQRLKHNKPSSVPYNKTRNRESKVLRLDCPGHISVIMPSPENEAGFDIAMDFEHKLHHGREYYGVPLKI